MRTNLYPRSYLFVPAHKPALITKALRCAADAVIVDMEDAVPPHDKAEARNEVVNVLTCHDPEESGPQVWLRINEPGSPDAKEDLAVFAGLVFGFRVPKADRRPTSNGQPPGPMGHRSSSPSRQRAASQLHVI